MEHSQYPLRLVCQQRQIHTAFSATRRERLLAFIHPAGGNVSDTAQNLHLRRITHGSPTDHAMRTALHFLLLASLLFAPLSTGLGFAQEAVRPGAGASTPAAKPPANPLPLPVFKAPG